MYESVAKTKGYKKGTKKEVSFLLFSFWALLFTLLAVEFCFKVIQYGFNVNISYLTIALFSLAMAGAAAVILSFLPLRAGLFLHGLLSFIMALYAVFQLGIYHMMQSYTTLHTAGTMGMAMGDYVVQYLVQVPFYDWLLLMIPAGPLIIGALFLKIVKSKNRRTLIILIVTALLSESGGLLAQYGFGDFEQYVYPTYQDIAISQYGIERFLLRDIASLFTEKKITVEIEETPTPAPAEPSETETPDVEEIDNDRHIDDTEWLSLSAGDDNENRVTIDNYLMSRTIDGYNDKTGLLDGKNLIYIMIEAFDYLAIDEVLTPTLYKMMDEGWIFANHYTPKFNTGTADSELISEVSLLPRQDINVYASFTGNDWTDSLFYLFNNAGYTTHAYHNWNDEFYPRKKMMTSLYCPDYEDYDDLPFTTIAGWQSDYDLIELTIDKYIDEDMFMTMYITSSTHFPYDSTWDVLGHRYLSEINEVHPDYPEEVKHYLSKAMELDKAMAYLLERLAEAGKLDDTAIVLFGDHHPLNMNTDYIIDYTTQVDRSGGKNLYLSPLIIYCPALLGDETFTGVSSTYDILPTVLNLYNLDYDPRLYFGTDYFSQTESIVYFPNGDWLTDQGIYDNSSGEFTSTNDAEVTDDYISRNTSRTNNAFNISYLIYTTDYFRYRPGITTPDVSKEISYG